MKIYQTLLEEFGYIAEAPGDQNEPTSFVSDKPAGDPSTMTPGEIRYNPDYDPNTGRLKGEPAPTDQKTDTNKPKPKTKFRHPGVLALQHFLTSEKFPVVIDGVMGSETSGRADALTQYWQDEQTRLFNKKSDDPKDPERKQKVQDNLYKLALLKGAANAKTGKPVPGMMMLGDKDFVDNMKKSGYDPKTGKLMPGAQSTAPKADTAAPAAAPAATSNNPPSGQGTQIDLPPELAQADTKEPFWIKGTRYEYKNTWDPRKGQWSQQWNITHKPGEMALNGDTRRAGNLGYTGPQSGLAQGVAKLDREKNLAAQQNQKLDKEFGKQIESTELDVIRKLSGLK